MAKKILVLFFLLSISFSQSNSQTSFPDLILDGISLSAGNHIYCNAGCIVASPEYTSPVEIIDEAEVEFISSTCVRMLPGFRAKDFSTGSFRARIVPQNAVIIEPGIDVPKYEKLELGITMPPNIQTQIDDFFASYPDYDTGINPYNPDWDTSDDGISVEATLTDPENHTRKAFGFFYRDYQNNAPTTNTWTELSTPYHWRLRFSPDIEGEWTGTISILASLGLSAPDDICFSFNCVSNTGAKGFLEHNTFDRFLNFSNTDPFFIVGENIWYGGGGYTDPTEANTFLTFMDELSSSGGNFIRTSLLPTVFGFEREHLGVYDKGVKHIGFDVGNSANYGFGTNIINRQVNAWELDRVVNFSNANDLYLYMVIGGLGDGHKCCDTCDDQSYVDLDWERNPYKVAFSIPDKNSLEFYANADSKQYFKRNLRYFSARYGYSPNIGVYDLHTEIDNSSHHCEDILSMPVEGFDAFNDTMGTWIDEMGDFIKNTLQDRHLMTLSYTGMQGQYLKKTLFDNSFIDLCTINSYDHRKEKLTRGRNEDFIGHFNTYNKPVIMTEMGMGVKDEDADLGAGHGSPDLEACTDVSFHNGLWTTAMSGGCGTGLNWWWENAIHPNEYYDNYTALNNFLYSDDFVDINSLTPRFWLDANSGGLYNTQIECYYLQNDAFGIGWVHNATYCWHNLASIYPCVDNFAYSMAIQNDIFTSPEVLDSSLTEIPLIGLEENTDYTVRWYYTRDAGGVYYTTTEMSDSYGTLTLHPPTMDNDYPDWAFRFSQYGFARMAGGSQDSSHSNSFNVRPVNGNNKINIGKNQISETIKPEAQSYLRIFPNPTKGKFSISSASKINSIEIVNVLGEKTYQSKNEQVNQSTIDLSSHASGIYFVKIQTAEKIFTQKLVIQ